jgi:hypothetical protein
VKRSQTTLCEKGNFCDASKGMKVDWVTSSKFLLRVASTITSKLPHGEWALCAALVCTGAHSSHAVVTALQMILLKFHWFMVGDLT